MRYCCARLDTPWISSPMVMIVALLLAGSLSAGEGGNLFGERRPIFGGEPPAPAPAPEVVEKDEEKPEAQSDPASEDDSAPRQHLADFGNQPGAGVTGSIFLSEVNLEAGTAILIARFVPPPPEGSAFHLYSKDLPRQGIDGMGRPTLLEIPPGQPLAAIGELSANAAVKDKEVLDWVFPLYEAGPVELRLPVRLPAGDGAPIDLALWVTYMTCNDELCLAPVDREVVAVALPSVSNGAVGDAAAAAAAAATEPQQPKPRPSSSSDGPLRMGHWYSPQNRAELEELLRRAEAARLPAFLDFTGPTCVNCQIMKRTVFEVPVVEEAFANLVLLSINTDPPHADLGQFQVDQFGTFTRPFYVRTRPGSDGQAWATFFRPGNSEQLERFVGFLEGGEGDAPATIDGIGDSVGAAGGWGGFLLLAVLGGLFTLVMPCTYPMIPLTVNFFTKQGEKGHSTLPLAATYAFGILAFFVLVGVLFTALVGSNPAYIAGHWMTNLIIGLLFLVLGASLLGLFFLRLPAGMANIGGGRAGYGGALMMGLAFAIISFTCTAPFAGLVLGTAMLTGMWSAAIIGMSVYAAVIAIPFFFLALSPRLLTRLPGAGAWMNEFKVVGGLIEIAAAFKFLYITDLVLGWGLIDRTTTLAIWAAIAGVISVYLSGKLRMESDAPITAIGPWRLLLIIAFACLSLICIAGLSGTHLGAIEGLFP